MADFQNRLISRIFGVFSSGLLQKTTLTWLKNLLSHVFLNVNFWPKLTILQRLQPLHDGQFSKSSHFSKIWCFLNRFFAQNKSNMIKESFFRMFFWIWIFDPNWLFCKGYSRCMMADFQNRLISRTFCVFSIGFLHRTSLTWLKIVFCMFFEFEFLTQTDYFAKAIAFAWWPIFKIVSFLEYLVFSQAVFCRKQL